jgi:hypothetical protein
VIAIPAGGILAAALLAAAGCSASAEAVDGGEHIPDFTACAKTDAGPYMAGLVSTSGTGMFTTTLVSVSTQPKVGAVVAVPTVGTSTFEVTFLQGGGPPTGLMVTAEKPYMPLHGHGSPVFPIVADDGGGAFTISNISFFMGGYWEVTLDLKFPPVVMDAGAGDGASATDAGVGDGASAMDAGVADEAGSDAPDETDASGDGPAGTDAGDDGSVIHAPPVTTDKVVIPICIPS